MSDINDRYEDGDPDVISGGSVLLPPEITATILSASPPVDIAAAAVNIMRVVDDRATINRYRAGTGCGNDDRGAAGTDIPAPPSSGSRDLAAMLMFDLDREAER